MIEVVEGNAAAGRLQQETVLVFAAVDRLRIQAALAVLHPGS